MDKIIEISADQLGQYHKIPGNTLEEKEQYMQEYLSSVIDEYCSSKQDVEKTKNVISARKLLEILENYYQEYRNLKYYNYHGSDVKGKGYDFLIDFVQDVNAHYQKVIDSRVGHFDLSKMFFLIKNRLKTRNEKSENIRCVQVSKNVDDNSTKVYIQFLKYGYPRQVALIKFKRYKSFDVMPEYTNLEEWGEFVQENYEKIMECFALLERYCSFIPKSRYLGEFRTFDAEFGDETFSGVVKVSTCADVKYEMKMNDSIDPLEFFKHCDMKGYVENHREVLDKISVNVNSIQEPIKSVITEQLEKERKLVNVPKQ